MDIGAYAEKLMFMDERAWAKHANPWSGWTRVATFPLLTLTIWSREWIGWWSLVLTLAVIAWVWINPRLFPAPTNTDNWMSRGVLGERIWLARHESTIPVHHDRMAALLNYASAAALLPWIWGVVTLQLWPAMFGMIMSMTLKLWFVDRMVQLSREAEELGLPSPEDE